MRDLAQGYAVRLPVPPLPHTPELSQLRLRTPALSPGDRPATTDIPALHCEQSSYRPYGGCSMTLSQTSYGTSMPHVATAARWASRPLAVWFNATICMVVLRPLHMLA